MSLTVLVHTEAPIVIARWFFEPKGLVLHAGGPVEQTPLEEFRVTGYDLVHCHFEDYEKRRVPEDEILPVFNPGEAEKFMKNRRVLQIRIDPQQNLVFSPMIVEGYNLGHLKRVKPISEQRIPTRSTTELFWKVFDQVIAIAPISK